MKTPTYQTPRDPLQDIRAPTQFMGWENVVDDSVDLWLSEQCARQASELQAADLRIAAENWCLEAREECKAKERWQAAFVVVFMVAAILCGMVRG